MRILFALAAAHAARLGSRKVEGRASPDENALVTRVAEVVREKHDVMTWWSAAREPSGQSIEPRGTAARVDRNESRHRGGTATQMDRSESRHRGGTAARVDRMLRGLDRSATPAPQGPTGAQVFLADRFADAVLDEKRMQTLIDFGYPEDYVRFCLLENEACYCLAGYYLLGEDQNY